MSVVVFLYHASSEDTTALLDDSKTSGTNQTAGAINFGRPFSLATAACSSLVVSGEYGKPAPTGANTSHNTTLKLHTPDAEVGGVGTAAISSGAPHRFSSSPWYRPSFTVSPSMLACSMCPLMQTLALSSAAPTAVTNTVDDVINVALQS